MNNENSEITNNISQPDPAWDYYPDWHLLNHIKVKIEASLKIMSKNEVADVEVDKQIKKLLIPASDQLTGIIDRLPDDDEEE